jgi:methionine synthase I (cobalamin-dependent)
MTANDRQERANCVTLKPDASLTLDVFAYLERTLKERIMFLDGAMGTMIQKLRLDESHFRGIFAPDKRARLRLKANC